LRQRRPPNVKEASSKQWHQKMHSNPGNNPELYVCIRPTCHPSCSTHYTHKRG
jgi:hypothetical protein